MNKIWILQTRMLILLTLQVVHPEFQNTDGSKHKLDFKTQYNQFYICDKSSPCNTGSNNFWTDEAYNTRLAVEDGIVGVGTQCYGHVKGDLILLKILTKEIDLNKYDHIVEGGLNIKSGILQVLDCPNSKVELELKVNPGRYRIRVYSSNVASTNGDEDEGNDFYEIEI